MTIHLNALERRNFYIESSNRNYTSEHGLIYFTLKLTYHMGRFDEYAQRYTKKIMEAYKEAGWTKNHTTKELMEIFEVIKEHAVLIPKSEFDNNTHIWNA